MARERKVIQRADGSLYYELERNRLIPVPGTTGLQVSERVEVPQIKSDGMDVDEILQQAINMVEGADDKARAENLASIINSGLVKEAEVALQGRLIKRLNESAIVGTFASFIQLAEKLMPEMSESERAKSILANYPDLRTKLEAAGLSLVDDTTTDTDSDTDSESE